MSLFNVDHVAIEMAGIESQLNRATLVLLGLAYHLYQKENHLLGDLSFSDWVDNLANEFESSDYFPKD